MASIMTFRDKDGNLIDIPALQGPRGKPGKLTNVTASVDDTIGTPSVAVTLGGTEEERTLDLAFSGLKGESGEGSVAVDTTLTQAGVAADAKATGDAIAAINNITVSDIMPESDIWIDTSSSEVINIPQIDDTAINENDTWSSSKINSAIFSMTSIDDTITSETSTWSSSKIAKAINNMFSSLPNAEEASF